MRTFQKTKKEPLNFSQRTSLAGLEKKKETLFAHMQDSRWKMTD